MLMSLSCPAPPEEANGYKKGAYRHDWDAELGSALVVG
jgi:hypothetical protein